MKLKFFIIISTVSIIISICLIISEHKSNAKPASTTDKQGLKCEDPDYECTNDYNQNHRAYQDKNICGSVDVICTHPGDHIEGYKPPVFKQRFKEEEGVCKLAGCCCSKPRRRDSTA